MKKYIILLVLLLCTTFVRAQNKDVLNALKTKYTLAQYHPEYGGWYFISYQKGGQTLYGFTDSKGNVISSEASKYKLHKGYIELYLVDLNKKAEHDQWILDMKQYQEDYQKYRKIKTDYENEVAAYKAKVKAAEQEATDRWNYARNAAAAKARKEYEAKQKAQQANSSSGNSSILGAVLVGVANAAGAELVASNAANAIAYEPYLNQVLGERNLSVEPSAPYNPIPTKPTEPATGYYWKSFSLLQPCPYDYIDFESIAEVDNFANVEKDGKYGMVDSYLKEIVPCVHSTKVLQKKLTSELFLIRKNALLGVVDKNAKTIIPCEYTSIELESDKIKVCKDKQYGLFSQKGEVIMPCMFEQMNNSNGYLLCQKKGLWGVYTTDFEELYPCQFQNASFGRMNKKLILNTQIKGLWGVIDFETGQTLLPNSFSKIETINVNKEICYLVSKDDYKGLYSSNGILILPCQFNRIAASENSDLISVYKNSTDGVTVGLYTSQGVPWIKEGTYNDYSYKDSWFYVCKNGKWGVYIPWVHTEVVPCKYDDIVWNSDVKVFQVKNGGQYTFVTSNGLELFPYIDASIIVNPSLSDEYIVFSISQYETLKTYGAIDYDGNVIVPAKFSKYKVADKVEKYAKKVDITTSHNEKMNIIQDANSKVNNLMQAGINEQKNFSYFAQNYVEKIVNEWQKRGEFEKIEEYKKRVNSVTRQQKVYSLTKEAQNIYIDNYLKELNADEVKIIGSYDADNETYRFTTSHFPNKELLVNVPADYAQEFKATFSTLKRRPIFFVENDGIGLAEYAFTMSNGQTFKYSNQASLTYSVAQVDYKFDAIEIDKSASNNNYQGGKQTISIKNMNYGTSDVDVNIPEALHKQENLYAIIIANENYENEKNVEYAYNDGQVFYEYCIKALGIPEKQVHFRSDATLNNMTFEINWLKQIAKACDGDAKFIFYYAGHGVPEDNMEDAYLLPVDGFSSDLSSGYRLSDLYAILGDIPAENVLVLLDACFSGSQRSGEHMASARGVSLKVKLDAPKGNMVVFSAASGNETAHPYKEKYHGLFTYYLLKKIQEEKDGLNLGDLSDYVRDNVQKVSLLNNSKSQTPTVSSSGSMKDVWRELIIK